VLEHFNDWDRVELQLYEDATSYNPATGQVESGYILGRAIDAFVFQSNSMQGVVSDKIVDQSDYVVVYETAISETAIVFFNDGYFQVVGVDNILFQNEVWVFGLKRTEKPNVVSGVIERPLVLGDFSGVIGES
jgi:hypothetical protein